MSKAYFLFRIVLDNKVTPMIIPISDKEDNVLARILMSLSIVFGIIESRDSDIFSRYIGRLPYANQFGFQVLSSGFRREDMLDNSGNEISSLFINKALSSG